ncbi:hypothetical protein [Pseudoalteromonas nigrifaciens]|uniref:hypothetical protein n=1 Tax=Pseudoalteromonas nigrifaciens TaxID=28109 RepID=UPI003FD3C7A4
MLHNLLNSSLVSSDISNTVNYLSIEAHKGSIDNNQFNEIVNCGCFNVHNTALDSVLTLESTDKSVFIIAINRDNITEYRALSSLYTPSLNDDQIVTSLSLFLNDKLN